jgi:N,N'-diacetyllegionaminate synthase
MKIIAEIAQGYEGSPELCKLLTKAAIGADADIVKYQIIYANELCTRDYAYFDFFQTLEMEDQVWLEIVNHIHEAGKEVFFDVYGERSLQLAIKLRVDGVKVSTTEFYNTGLILKALKTLPCMVLSVAGIQIEDIDYLLSQISNADRSKLIFMYGFQSEPTPLHETNLNKLKSFKERYPDIPLGFMDHTDGALEESIHIPLIAFGTGIEYIEKHITLDRILEIEDFVSALDATRFKMFVKIIRSYECALGQTSLNLTEAENAYRKKAGKVVVALKNLPAGKTISEKDISLKRVPESAEGTKIIRLGEVAGKTLIREIQADSAISAEDIK